MVCQYETMFPRWLCMPCSWSAVLLVTVFMTVDSLAQSATVIGNTPYSRECFSAAELAVTFNVAGDSDINVCNKALEDVNLTRVDRAATLVNRGILESAAGYYDQARASYDEALELADDKGETHINIGNIHVRQERYRQAVDEYSKGIDKSSRRPHVAFLNRGLAYEYLNEFEDARDDYRRALELLPDWIRAKKMLARVELKLTRQNESSKPTDD